ncbi:MAG TPA: 50S ribosomal protein L25 [bacterium]|nr:50S ribosomal protein L25 [bacterium]
MANAKLTAQARDAKGKGAAREARRAGLVPAVIYGENKDPLKLKLNRREIDKLLAYEGSNVIIDLDIEGSSEKNLAMIKEIQYKPIAHVINHVDLIRISMDKKVHISVPLVIINDEGVKKKGGIIQQLVTEVTVECFPDKIPESIELDLADAELGYNYNVGDLKISEDFSLTDEEEEVLVSIVAPKDEVAAAPAEGEEGAEGEEDKKDEE